MKTTELSEIFNMPHKSIVRIVNGMVERGLFSQSEIEKMEYTTGQNKRHVCYELADTVVVYMITTRRAFRDGNERVSRCASVLARIGASHRVVVGDATRNERKFGIMLEEFFGGSISISHQHYIAGFYVDFYIPELSIAIEYDERHHNTIANKKNDKDRVHKINQYVSSLEDCGDVIWIRVDEGFEMAGVRRVVGAILHHGLDSHLDCLGFGGAK